MTPKQRDKLRLSLHGIFIFIALLMLSDFILPGKVFTDEIIQVEKKKQQYYNAARNYHYSYKVNTNKHRFSVSENFARLVQNNQKIKYSVSRIFKEINRYGLLISENSTIYSFRIISGLIIPLMVIIAIGISYKYKHKMSTLIFVLQITLIGNLIILIN